MQEQRRETETNHIDTQGTQTVPAVRLFNNVDGSSTFERGTIPTLKPMNTTTFWISNTTEEWQKNTHPAPRRQYVVTIQGRLRFKVSDGSTFIIEPGIILLAEDTKGEGHSWEMIDSEKWERLYIPISNDAEDYFTKEI